MGQGLAGWFLSFGLGEKYVHKEPRRMICGEGSGAEWGRGA